MSEVVSVPMDLIPCPLFRKKYNICYSDDDFDETDKWELVLSNNCPNNLSDCVDSDGLLDNSVTESDTEDISLSLVEEGDIGCYVSIADNVEMSVDGDVDVKAIFLRKKENGFVLMGMVNQKPMRFCDGMTFEEGNVLFVIEG